VLVTLVGAVLLCTPEKNEVQDAKWKNVRPGKTLGSKGQTQGITLTARRIARPVEAAVIGEPSAPTWTHRRQLSRINMALAKVVGTLLVGASVATRLYDIA
jgi:hypothetical protein